ncbi:hypothetical protein SCALM49S_06353 [Streptomyces californicus]
MAAVDTDQPPAGPATHGLNTWCSAGRWSARRRWSAPSSSSRWPTSSACPRSCSRSRTARSPRTTACCPRRSARRWTARSWATAQCRPHPTEPLDEYGQGDAFVGLGSARYGRWSTSTSSSARSAWSRWRLPRTSAGLNPAQLATRIEAGITQGIGAALTENLRTARGLIRHPDLTGYALPTSLDAPDIRIVRLIEERDVVAPFGAKPASAVPVATAPAAVAAAVRSATGRPVNRLPIRPQERWRDRRRADVGLLRPRPRRSRRRGAAEAAPAPRPRPPARRSGARASSPVFPADKRLRTRPRLGLDDTVPKDACSREQRRGST